MTIETLPIVDIGSAANAVVEKVAEKRSSKPKPIVPVAWDKKKISVDGLYADIPIETYHSNICAGPSISSSGLRKIENESPAHYWCESYLNPEAEPREISEALVLGSAAHHLLFGEGTLAEKFAVRPAEFDSWRTKASKEWRAGQQLAGKMVLEEKHLKTIRGMAKSLAAHPLINPPNKGQGLLNGIIESSLIWKDKETGVWLKSRPDAIPLDTEIVDLKTAADASARGVRSSIADQGYHLQLALVGMGMEAILGRKAEDFHYTLVFVEKTPPFAVNIKPIDPNAIYWGRRELRRAIRTFADCLSKGDWPAYADDMMTASLPEYYTKRLEADDRDGLLPDEKAA